MDFYDYILNRNAAQEENPDRLSSYRQAAELICLCWNRLDMSFVEPYLDEEMVWKGGVPHRVINGKNNFLKLMRQVFDSLQYSKRSYRADVDGAGDHSVAIVTVDGEYQDMMHRVKIEDGLIKEIEVTPSGYLAVLPVMTAICFVGTFVTEFISNTAAGAMFFLIMYEAAEKLGYDPYPFLIALMNLIILAANILIVNLLYPLA